MATETKVIEMKMQLKGDRQVTNGVKKMSGAAKGATSSFDSFKKSLLQFAGITAITVALKKATTAALGFGSAMAEVKTLLDDTSQFEVLTANVKALSLEFGQSPVAQAKALYQVISAGAQNAAEATDILTVSNKLSIAGITDVAVAADALTTVLNAYQGAAGSAIDISDKFFVAVKAGKTTIDELATSIGSVSGVAAQVGVSLDEVLAATAALTKGTLNTARSIRGLRAVMTAIIKPTSEAVELADALGLEFTAAALQSKGFAAFLGDVSEATQNNSALLAQLFGNVEGLVPIMALAGTASEDFKNILDAMGEATGKTDEAFEIMAATAQFKLNRFMTSLQVIGISLGNVLLTVLAPAAELAADNMDLLATAIVGVTVAVVALKFTAIIAGLKAIVLGIKAFTVALLATPIGWIVAGLTAITLAVVVLNKKFMIFEPLWELLKTGFLLFINSMREGLNNFLNWIDGLFAKLRTKLDEFKIAYQEGLVFIASKIGTDAGFENAVRELERLKSEQLNYNDTLKETIEGRLEANRKLVEENALLSENWDLAKKQLFTEREKQEVAAGGGAPNVPSTTGDPDLTGELKKQQELQLRLLDLQERGKALIISLRTPMEIYKDQIRELNELYEAEAIDLETLNRAQVKYQEELQASQKETEVFGDLMEKAINGTLTAKDLFLVAVRQILRGLTDMNNEAQSTTDSFLELANSLGGGGGIGGSIGSIIGSIFGSFFSPAPVAPTPSPSFSGFSQPGILAANGGVHSRGVVKFAKGDIFSTPQNFSLAGGKTGQFAEAGSEAIMPLQRTADGKLGVSTSGSSSNVVINIVDQRSGGEKAQVKQSTDPQGNKKYDIFIRDSVNRTFGNGGFDKSMKQFGVARGGNRS